MDIVIYYGTGAIFGLDPLVVAGGWSAIIIGLGGVLYFSSKRLGSLSSHISVVVGKIHQILDACLFVLYQKMPHDASLREMVRQALHHTDYKKQFDALQDLASSHGLPDYRQPFEQLWKSYRSLRRWRLFFYVLSFVCWLGVVVSLGGLGLALWVYPR